MCRAQGHNAVTPVRLKPLALRSLVKHSTTEPLCSQSCVITKVYDLLGQLSYIYNAWWLSGLGRFLVIQQPDAQLLQQVGPIFIIIIIFFVIFSANFLKKIISMQNLIGIYGAVQE